MKKKGKRLISFETAELAKKAGILRNKRALVYCVGVEISERLTILRDRNYIGPNRPDVSNSPYAYALKLKKLESWLSNKGLQCYACETTGSNSKSPEWQIGFGYFNVKSSQIETTIKRLKGNTPLEDKEVYLEKALCLALQCLIKMNKENEKAQHKK